MASKITIFRGDTFQGTITLRVIDACDSTKQNPFVLDPLDTIAVYFPGTASSVILSSATPGEITILDAALGKFSYKGDPVKSALLKLGTAQALDVVYTTAAGDVTTFEKVKIVEVKDRANP